MINDFCLAVFSLNEFWKVIGIYKPSRFVWGGDALLPGRFAHVCSRSPSKRIAMHVQHFLKVCYIRGIFSKSCLTGWFRCRFRNTCHDWHMLVNTILKLAVTLEHLLLGSLYFFSIFCEQTRLCSVYSEENSKGRRILYDFMIFVAIICWYFLRKLEIGVKFVFFWWLMSILFSLKPRVPKKTFGAYHDSIYSHKEIYA